MKVRTEMILIRFISTITILTSQKWRRYYSIPKFFVNSDICKTTASLQIHVFRYEERGKEYAFDPAVFMNVLDYGDNYLISDSDFVDTVNQKAE